MTTFSSWSAGFQFVRDLMEPAGDSRTGVAGEGAQLDGVFAEKGDVTQEGQVFASHLCSPRGAKTARVRLPSIYAPSPIYKALLARG